MKVSVFWLPQIPFAFEFWVWTTECLVYGQIGRHFKIKIFIFLSVNGWMVIQMTCVRLNCHSVINTQTQTQTETEGYRMHEGEYLPLKIRSKNHHSNTQTLKSMFTIRWFEVEIISKEWWQEIPVGWFNYVIWNLGTGRARLIRTRLIRSST